MAKKEYYPLLMRQLKQVGIDLNENLEPIPAEQILRFLDKINSSYDDYSKRIKTLERITSASSDDINSYILKLRATEEDLKRSDENRTRFFQNISHELRTPLTLMLNPLEEEVRRDSQNHNVSMALKHSKRMLRLINQLLGFQKITNSQARMTLQKVDIRMIAELCCDFFRSSCQDRGVAFSLLFSDNLSVIPVMGQIDAIENIFFNYLSNALKFTPSGGSITVICALKDKGWVEIRVVDSGPGISEENIKSLFQLFSQVNESDGLRGTGIGLAYVKELVISMMGEIGVQSKEGEGSEFWFRLPYCFSEEPFAESSSQEQLSNRDQWILDEAKAEVDAAEKSHLLIADEKAHTVLVLDDLKEMRSLIASILFSDGIRVVQAGNAEEAFEKISIQRPDVIITDWMMPGMSGPEFIKKLRADVHNAGIPVVLLTAKSDEESKVKGIFSGANAHIGKPFDRIELISAVRNLIIIKSQEKQIERLNQHLAETVLKRYLPPDLVNKIVKGEISFEDKVKVELVTILFCDIFNFTAISGELGPHRIAAILNEFLSEMTDVIFICRGTIDKFMGDGIMVIFGAPEPLLTQEQAQKAVECAEKMQAKINEMNIGWLERYGQDLTMRIGIHQGAAIVGNFGGSKRSDYTAIGPTVNVASRVENAAEPGAIFFTGVIRDFLPDNCWTKAGAFELKGIESTCILYRLKTTIIS